MPSVMSDSHWPSVLYLSVQCTLGRIYPHLQSLPTGILSIFKGMFILGISE